MRDPSILRRSPIQSLRRALLLRLLVLLTVLVPVLGSAVVIVHLQRLERFISALAVHEAEEFALEHPGVVTGGGRVDPADVNRALARSMAASMGARVGRYVAGRVYDREGELVAAAQVPEVWDAVGADAGLAGVGNGLGPGILFSDGPILLRVALQLRVGDGPVFGRFHGLFMLSDEAVTAVRREALASAGATALVIAATGVAFYPVILSLTRRLVWRSQRLLHAHIDALETLGSALAKRDADTERHSGRVTLYAVHLAEGADLPAADIRRLAKGALLHDVGKIGVPDAILLKPGRLSPEETAVMQSHVLHGVDIVRRSAWLSEARDVVGGHHERYDGTGYPEGKMGEDIPVSARVFAIVDVFDALTTRRPYKEPMSLEEALAVMGRERGTHFDPRLLDRFFTIAPALYRRLANATPEEMRDELQTVLAHYFAVSKGAV